MNLHNPSIGYPKTRFLKNQNLQLKEIQQDVIVESCLLLTSCVKRVLENDDVMYINKLYTILYSIEKTNLWKKKLSLNEW